MMGTYEIFSFQLVYFFFHLGGAAGYILPRFLSLFSESEHVLGAIDTYTPHFFFRFFFLASLSYGGKWSEWPATKG